jgi:peptidoglycan hydrolase-like protein with peptidoglycan-binding domain
VGPLSQDDWKAFQEILKRDHGYTGAIDGLPGGLTYRSLQRSVVAHGYSGPIDGEPGGNTYKALQRRLVAKGHYEGRVDGILGSATYSAWKEAIQKNRY